MTIPAPGRLAPALADRYRIEKELGQGGMATVYLAHDLRHERRVALKVMRPELAAVIGAERFLQEIKTTANLQHPHILPLFDSGQVEGTVFYVMPYVEGESLRDRLTRESQLPVDQALRITKEVAGALDYAHRKGVIHRDIKPENILLHDGQALVADFGIALAASAAGGSRLTQTGLSLGTPSYMSPEQAMGERTLDARTDQYALGCVLFELLAGEPPFTGPTAQSIVARVLSGEPPRLTEVRKSVPPGVEAAVLRALEQLPADRFETVAEFATALDAPRGTGTAARPGRRTVTAPPAWRPWAMLAGGIGVGVALAWGLGALRGRATVDGEPRQLAIALPDTAPFVAGQDEFGTALNSLDLSRDGKALAYVSRSTAGTRLVLVRLDNGTVRILPGTEGARSPAFSPDGQAIAFVHANKVVRRLSLDDGRIADGPAASGSSLRWHPDGKIYLNGGCRVAPAMGGKGTRLAPEACLANWVMSEGAFIDPASEWMLLQARGVIQLVSRRSGAVRELPLPGPAAGTDSTARLYGHSPRYVPPGFLVFVRGSTLYAARFDRGALRLTSVPQPVVSNIRREQSGQAQLAVSDDGTLVWAEGGDESLGRFVWVTRDGRVQDTLFVPAAEVGSYALSPDGRRLAYSTVRPDRGAELMIADLERRVVDRVDYPPRLDPLNWVRGGRALSVLLSHPDLSGRGALVRFDGAVPAVDTGMVRLENESPNGAWRCLESPDLLINPFGAKPFLQGMTPGSDSVQLAETGSWCRFSPDSRFLVWSSSDGVFAAATRTGGLERVLVGPAGNEPRWSADGRQILYRDASSWYAVPAPTSDLRPTGAPGLLFTGGFLQALASWDQGPDGRLLLLQGEPPVRLTSLHVITNLPRFLEQRLGERGAGQPRE